MTTAGGGPVPATDEFIAAAGRLVRSGRLVAFPTETVYGLGADACNDHAVAAVFAAKGRPSFNPLIVHVHDMESASGLAVLNDLANKAAEAFWPGPLTLVLPRLPDCPISLLASAGLDTLAVRVPSHPIARRFLAAAQTPVVAPSANRSAGVSPTMAVHVERSLGDVVDLILDGGSCPVGIESTVIDLTSDRPVLLRPGGLDTETLESVLGPLGRPSIRESGGPVRSPGMLARHYAPDRPIRLNVSKAKPDEALLAFGSPSDGAALTLNLSLTGDLREAAANLFRMMHEADDPRYSGIAVMPIPSHGLGEAINDRLRRAATLV